MSQQQRIQTKLLSLVDAASFRPVSYDSSGSITVDTGSSVVPSSRDAHEVSASVIEDTRHGLDRIRRLDSWRWELRLSFHQEVSVEEFVDSLMLNVPTMSRDSTHRAFYVLLEGFEVEHPPRQQSHGGTRALFTFNIQQSPR